MRKAMLSAAALLVVAAMAVYAQMPKGIETHKTSTGETVLANAKGMTLYTYDKDTADKSNCNGACAKIWPPVKASASENEGDYTVVTRDDGSKQLAYKHMPLYTYAKDMKAGEAAGNGMGNGAWHLATP
jgi:predicted lipoprotein with Yx(FWY)xxD motif